MLIDVQVLYEQVTEAQLVKVVKTLQLGRVVTGNLDLDSAGRF